ncbi:MAG: cyclic 2,3-diphosphoglycerate synthase [Candidatus Hodarchaeota archaeon]
MGAAGRDFHNFNVYFRNNKGYRVIAFTASQIPNIANRLYHPRLAGPNYPNGIPIYSEEDLPNLIKEHDVDQVVLAYSDLSHEEVMHKASLVLSCGSDFRLMGLKSTTLVSRKPVISVCAVRTGAGKSPTTRRVGGILRNKGYRIVVIRHPMPYGDLTKQISQRFATFEDLDKYHCTIEEREDYAPHIEHGIVVYSGVDYEKILREAEKESDVILWDGGNNDLPFIKPDLHIVVTDPHRPGHEVKYHPGEANLRMADVVIINKVDTANQENVESVRKNIENVNPKATIIMAVMQKSVDNGESIKGKRVLVIEDGPTITHGGMAYGAGMIMARKLGAEVIDPRPYSTGSIKRIFEKYPHIGKVLPAVGYGEEQIKDLEDTINAVNCDVVVIGTPIDLTKVMNIDKPTTRVRYELQEIAKPNLEDVIESFERKMLKK